MARRPAKGGKGRRTARPSGSKRPAARPARKVSPVPAGHHTVTPNLVLKDSAAAIAFYEKALGAKELMRMPAPDGKGIWHAELRIGDSVIYLNDEMPMSTVRAPGPSQPATCSMVIYVADCDALFRRAIDAGATQQMPLADMFWGDRMGTVTDPFGVTWMIATHLKDLSEKELARAAEAARAAAGAQTTTGTPGAESAAAPA